MPDERGWQPQHLTILQNEQKDGLNLNKRSHYLACSLPLSVIYENLKVKVCSFQKHTSQSSIPIRSIKQKPPPSVALCCSYMWNTACAKIPCNSLIGTGFQSTTFWRSWEIYLQLDLVVLWTLQLRLTRSSFHSLRQSQNEEFHSSLFVHVPPFHVAQCFRYHL